MEKLFEFLIDLFLGEVAGILLIWALVGVIICLVGIAIIVIGMLHVIIGKKVSLRVSAIHDEARTIKDDDDEERRAEKLANPRKRVEYTIESGPHAGMVKQSSTASLKTKHVLGEIEPGYLSIGKGRFEGKIDMISRKEVLGSFRVGATIFAVGLGFILLIRWMAGDIF